MQQQPPQPVIGLYVQTGMCHGKGGEYLCMQMGPSYGQGVHCPG